MLRHRFPQALLARAAAINQARGNEQRAYARRACVELDRAWEVAALARQLWRPPTSDDPVRLLRRCLWLGVHAAIAGSDVLIDELREEFPDQDLDVWLRDFLASVDADELLPAGRLQTRSERRAPFRSAFE